jgi:serine protease Do
VTLAKEVMNDLIKYGKVQRAVIGVAIKDATAADAKAAGLDKVTGVLVSAYSFTPVEDSPAKKAGIEPGDVIISADGKPTDRVSTLQRIVREHKPGETITFDAMRFGSKKSFNVKLAPAPDDQQQVADADQPSAQASPAARQFDKIGISVEPVSPDLVNRVRLASQYRAGLLVSDVKPAGPSYGKLFSDQTILLQVINPGPRRDLKTAADLDAVLSRLHNGDLVTFMVYYIGQQDQTAGPQAVTVQIGG